MKSERLLVYTMITIICSNGDLRNDNLKQNYGTN